MIPSKNHSDWNGEREHEGRTLRKGVVVVVEELLRVEGTEALQNTVANAAGTDGPDDLALKILDFNSKSRALDVRRRYRLTKAFLAMFDTCQSPRSAISCAGTKFRMSRRIDIMTCSATETTLDPDTSRTWMPCSTAASRSM